MSAINTPDEPVDGDAVEVDVPADATPSTAVAVIAQGGGIIRAEDPREILAKAKQIAVALKELIDSAGLAVSLDRRNPDRKHVEVGGWQAAGTLLGALGGQPLHSETVWTRPVAGDDGRAKRTQYTATVKRYHSKNQGGGLREEITYDVDGLDWEACVEIKTPAGVIVGRAEAMVSRSEETWSRRDDYALRSMAETRAESRAYRKAIGWIVHIAGYNPTPAEEMGHTPGADTSTTGAVFGPQASDEQGAAMARALHYLFNDTTSAMKVMAAIDEKAGGYMPDIAARAVVTAASAIKAKRESAPPQTAAAARSSAPDDEAVIARMLEAGDQLAALRQVADAGMRALKCGVAQRRRDLEAANTEIAVEALITRIQAVLPEPTTQGAPA